MICQLYLGFLYTTLRLVKYFLIICLPMSQEYISINDASELSGKSIQTIRRAIKAGKVKCKKQRTPQGFNYLILKDSLVTCYGIRIESSVMDEVAEELMTKDIAEVKEVKAEKNDDSVTVALADLDAFKGMLESMISQHSEERQNFLRLINNLQEKIFVLENQMNLLKTPEKSWFQFWK